MNKLQERMICAVKYLTGYMKTYDKQPHYENYSDFTYIEDILYGLGVSLSEEYKFAQGFDKFKEVLREHLKKGETD